MGSKGKRRPKSLDERCGELVGDLDKLEFALHQFELSNADHWVQAVAGTLHKLLVKRRMNTPLLIDVAKVKSFPLIVYVSNSVIADQKAEKAGRPKPLASAIPNILSTDREPWFSTPMPLDQAIELRCLVLGGQEFTFKDILINIRDTEGHHSDPDRPEDLDKLDRLEILGYSGAYMAAYHLGQIVAVMGRRFVATISGG